MRLRNRFFLRLKSNVSTSTNTKLFPSTSVPSVVNLLFKLSYWIFGILFRSRSECRIQSAKFVFFLSVNDAILRHPGNVASSDTHRIQNQGSILVTKFSFLVKLQFGARLGAFFSGLFVSISIQLTFFSNCSALMSKEFKFQQYQLSNLLKYSKPCNLMIVKLERSVS